MKNIFIFTLILLSIPFGTYSFAKDEDKFITIRERELMALWVQMDKSQEKLIGGVSRVRIFLIPKLPPILFNIVLSF